jgi:hypothetical protein
MRGPLPRVSAPGTHFWCVVDSKLGLGPASWKGGKEVVGGKSLSSEASCRTTFLSSGCVDGECFGGLMDRRTFEQPMLFFMHFCSQEGFSDKTSIQVRM